MLLDDTAEYQPEQSLDKLRVEAVFSRQERGSSKLCSLPFRIDRIDIVLRLEMPDLPGHVETFDKIPGDLLIQSLDF